MSRSTNRPKRAGASLLRWFQTHGRTLPWRSTRDPYRILVSEIMLQQTQVSRVLFFYSRWLKRFPNWSTLARANNAQVIRAWAGLGYNRRALMLRDIARQVVERGVPNTREEWQKLKGIGPYTSAALAAFSLHEQVMPIDTNIRRVLGRFFDGTPFSVTDRSSWGKKSAEIFLNTTRYFDAPQALFDLATLVCKKTPDCRSCPLSSQCKAAPKFLSGRVRIPRAASPKPHERRHRDKPHPDRIYRGRILALVRRVPRGLDPKTLGLKIDPAFQSKLDQPWLTRMIDRLIADGMLEYKNYRLTLAK